MYGAARHTRSPLKRRNSILTTTTPQHTMCSVSLLTLLTWKRRAPSPETVGSILRMMGTKISEKNLQEVIAEMDADGDGYITTDTLREILREIDNRQTEENLNGIIAEVDEDGFDTLDFDEFMEMMSGQDAFHLLKQDIPELY